MHTYERQSNLVFRIASDASPCLVFRIATDASPCRDLSHADSAFIAFLIGGVAAVPSLRFTAEFLLLLLLLLLQPALGNDPSTNRQGTAGESPGSAKDP